MDSRMYLHVDLDAFFASVEVLDNPELKGKPLIVGGLPGERRSVVSTCSYEARAYGVHSAMPTSRAYELCPQAVFLHGRMERYHEKSREVMNVFREYSPDVLQMSIDEAFVDITGTELLFGDPVTLAKALKKKVFEKTGLTVSVGIASNRYVAKIASGLKKPDGLCYVPAGDEEKFMLSLPLDKLWGIGTKTRERLNGCGIFTIPDIHRISETALKELFGEASGSFLYRSVRGMDVEHFGDEAKSRSMSAERTFCFDLTDIYGIETELLHLAYDVMFRVLNEKVNSKTVCLKIRYEDFTTVTVTESGTRIVSSIEDLFERACRLFHKKYERGRGIRLLGLGLQNISDGLESQQGELFDFGEKKLRSVEKTVLKLHQKNPSTKLKKARQLITPLAALFFMIGALHPLEAEDSEVPFSFTPSSLSVQNADIEFDVEGSWESLLSTGGTLIVGDTVPSLSIQPPVFTQKADVLLWFMYDNHWYFDAAVATDTDSNLVAAGYLGDGVIQEVRVGTDIGTEKQSPGIRINLQGTTWDAVARVHLDTVQTHTKTWNGSSELVSSGVPLSDWKQGFLFSTIDTDTALSITGVYVEDKNGTYTDTQSTRYKKLSQDEYLVIPGKGLLYLEKQEKGAVLATLSEKSSVQAVLPSFLSDISDWFGDRGAESTYSMMGLSCADETAGPSASETEPLFTRIGSISSSAGDALFLSKPGYFSPFQVASLYDASSEDGASVSVGNRKLYADFTPSLLMESDTLLQLHSTESSGTAFSEAAVRFPAARSFPWIYLPSLGVTEDAVPSITVTVAGQTDSFSIGSNAIENSIQVLKNGTPVPAAYDKNSGKVTIASGWTATDTITILWNEYSNQSEDMALTAAFDFNAAPTPFFTLSTKLASELFFDPDTRKLKAAPDKDPYTALDLTANWQRDFGNVTLSVSNDFSAKAVTVSKDQKLPLFTLSGNATEEVWFLDGAKQTDEVPVLTRRPSSAITPPVLDESYSSSFTVAQSRRQGISGYTLTIDGTLSENQTGTSWYALTIPLSAGSASLPSSHEFSFTLNKLETSTTDYDVWLKLGDSVWLISEDVSSAVPRTAGADVLKPFNLSQQGNQTVRVLLTDSDRLKLKGCSDMQIILVKSSGAGNADVQLQLSGSPSALSGISFNVRSETAGVSATPAVSITETPLPSGFESGWFSTGSTPLAARISWDTDTATSCSSIIVERSFPEASGSRWQKATLFMYVPPSSPATDVTVSLLSESDDGYAVAETFVLSESELAASRGSWFSITKDISSESSFSKVQYVFDAVPENGSGIAELYTAGIFLSEPVTPLTVSDGAATAIRYSNGELTAELAAEIEGSGIFQPQLSSSMNEKSLSSTAKASVSTPFLSLSGTGTFNMLSPSLRSGEYLVASGNKLFNGVIGFSDNYRFNRATDADYRKDTLSLSLVPLKVPLSLSSSLETDRTGSLTSGKAAFSAESSYAAGKTTASLTVTQTKAPSATYDQLGTADAKRRTENADFSQQLNFADGTFSPSLEIGLKNDKTRNKAGSIGSFSQKLTLPVSLGADKLSFIYARETAAEYLAASDGSYAEDMQAYTDAFSTHSDSLSIIPVYDLFQTDLSSKLQRSLNKASRTSRSTYTTSGTATWSRPLRANWLDLVLPNSVSLTASRTLSLAGGNVLDKDSQSLFLAFTAFNIFGKDSALELFDWYGQDEFQYSARFTTLQNDIKTELTGYGTLYITDDAQLTSFYTGSFTGKENYSHTLQFSWNRPAELFNKSAVRITTGTFGIRQDNTVARTVNTALSHKTTVNIVEGFSVNGAASINADIRDVKVLTVTLSLGGKLQF